MPRFGLTMKERVLSHVERQGEVEASQVRELVGPSASRVLHRLAALGAIEHVRLGVYRAKALAVAP
jgi:hypothetical protein